MKEETRTMIDRLQQEQYLNKLYKNSIIELDDYFAYSGKQEHNNTIIYLKHDFIEKDYDCISNDMTKYVLKDYKKTKNKNKLN